MVNGNRGVVASLLSFLNTCRLISVRRFVRRGGDPRRRSVSDRCWFIDRREREPAEKRVEVTIEAWITRIPGTRTRLPRALHFDAPLASRVRNDRWRDRERNGKWANEPWAIDVRSIGAGANRDGSGRERVLHVSRLVTGSWHASPTGIIHLIELLKRRKNFADLDFYRCNFHPMFKF